MKHILISLLVLLSGCVTMPQDARSRMRLAGAYSPGAPLREVITVGGRSIIISSMGYAFPDDSLAVEIDRLIRTRKKSGLWGVQSELATPFGVWKTAVVQDYLVLVKSSGENPLFDTLFVSPSGKIGVHAEEAPKLDKLEPLMKSIQASVAPSGSRIPYVIIPK